jgi:N-acetylneuraminic acid mutarotase
MKRSLFTLLYFSFAFAAMAQTGPWTQKNDFGATSPNEPASGSETTAFGIGNFGYVAAKGVDVTGDSTKNYLGQYDPATNTWTSKTAYPGLTGGVSFAVGGKGYMTVGVTNPGSFWQYDPVTDTWAQLADYPSANVTTPSIALSIGSKGYMGSGRVTPGTGYTTIFYEYDPATNVWTRKANQPDPLGLGGRDGAVAFSIGNKGYFGTGGNNQNFNSPSVFNDFWEYDPATDTWTQKASFGGTARQNAVGFSIGSFGYVGTGAGVRTPSSQPVYQDFWQYDPSTDTWTQKADYGGGALSNAVDFTVLDKGYAGSGSNFWQYDPSTDQWSQIAPFGGPKEPLQGIRFSLNGKGYIGLDGNSNILWEYDTLSDTWTQAASFPGTLRAAMAGFSIDDKGYAGTGVLNNAYFNDFWEFDPTANAWTQKANFAGGPREGTMAFSVGSKGYMGTGTTDQSNPFADTKDLWEYDPATDTWTQKADFGGSPRTNLIAFTVDNMGYAAGGNDTGNIASHKHDLWQYDPATDTWTQKADFPGGNRNAPIGFGADGMGYMGLGRPDTSVVPRKDLFQYDPTADTWTQVTDFPGTGREYANNIAVGNKAYIGGGLGRNATTLNDIWQFDPAGLTPLPLTLTDFIAVYDDPVTRLHWQTQMEQNTNLFTIRRSTDAKHFDAIGKVAAAGNSTNPKQYGFTDEGAGKTGASTLFYNLQETDLDGKSTYSPIVTVNIDQQDNGIIVSPNPATDNITLQIAAGAAVRANLIITDLAGATISGQEIDLYKGNNSIPIAVGSLAAGVYYVVVRSPAQSWQAKFIKK